MSQGSDFIAQLSKGKIISGTISIPASRSTCKKDISILLQAHKVKNLGYQLKAEKYFSNVWDESITTKYRKFSHVEDLYLYIKNNFSLSDEDLSISKETVVLDHFEENRPVE